MTALQLQQFGKRRWAGDLIRVLLRERQFVLSGFGSDEPQIWHVVMDILQEFEERRHAGASVGPRALWVAEYGTRIGFHILQALVEERRLRGDYPPFRFDNVFSGNDATYFGSGPGGLDAGDFWRMAWLEAICEGLRDEDGPAVHAFVRHMTGHRYRKVRKDDRECRDLWRQIVDRAFHVEEPLCCRLRTSPCHGWLSEPPREGTMTSRWARSGNAPLEREAPCAPHLTCVPEDRGSNALGWRYLPLHEEPEYWVTVLLLLLVCPAPCTGCRMEAAMVDAEPWIRLTRGSSMTATTSPATARSGPVLVRGREERSTLVLFIFAPLLEFVGKRWDRTVNVGAEKGLELLRHNVREYIETAALQCPSRNLLNRMNRL